MNKKQQLKEIGARLEGLRRQLDFTRDEMAVHFSLTRNGYAKNERGDTFPGLDTLFRLSKNYDISMDWLIFDKGPMAYREKEAVVVPPPEAPAPEPGATEPPVEAPAPEVPVIPPETPVTEPATCLLPPGLEPIADEIHKMLGRMANDPQFRHAILLYFYQYLKDHPEP
jgi:transcriptional regulator with XRE-family HTH domain